MHSCLLAAVAGAAACCSQLFLVRWQLAGRRDVPALHSDLTDYGVKERLITRWREVQQVGPVNTAAAAAATFYTIDSIQYNTRPCCTLLGHCCDIILLNFRIIVVVYQCRRMLSAYPANKAAAAESSSAVVTSAAPSNRCYFRYVTVILTFYILLSPTLVDPAGQHQKLMKQSMQCCCMF